MIDTITFELTNLRKHAHVYNKLVFQKSADYKTVLFDANYGSLEKEEYHELHAKPMFPFYDNGQGKFEVIPEYYERYKDSVFKPRFARGGSMEREITVSKNGKARENFSVHTWEGSYNYKIKARLSPWEDKITFEFSLPKYFMGCNVYQFVKTPKDANFSISEATLEKHAIRINSYIQFGVTQFLDIEYNGHIDFKDLYIKRVDLCYNLIFRNNEECMKYFDVLFKIHKNNHGQLNGSLTPYERETIFINTKDYSAKVYFKGAEFAKHDYKHLAEHFAKRGKVKDFVDLDTGEMVKLSKYMRKGKVLSASKYMAEVTDLANRTLRYEMTFRQGYMSLIFNSCVLRKHSGDWVQFKLLFGRMQFILTQKMHTGEKGFFVNDKNKKEAFVEDLKGIALVNEHYYEWEHIIRDLHNIKLGITGDNMLKYFTRHFGMKIGVMSSELKSLQLFYDKFNSWQQKTHKFSPIVSDKLHEDYREVDTCCDLAHAVTYRFSRRLTMAMWDKFKSFIDNYTIHDLPDHVKMVELIDRMKCKSIRKNQYKLVLRALEGGISLKDLKIELGWSVSTYQRYKNAFAKLGIDNQSFKMDIKPRFDFSAYYDFLIHNQLFAQEHIIFS